MLPSQQKTNSCRTQKVATRGNWVTFNTAVNGCNYKQYLLKIHILYLINIKLYINHIFLFLYLAWNAIS